VPTPAPLHLAVALDGGGWHPAAWREPDVRPQRLFTVGCWTELARHAERGLLDFLTIEDGRVPRRLRRHHAARPSRPRSAAPRR